MILCELVGIVTPALRLVGVGGHEADVQHSRFKTHLFFTFCTLAKTANINNGQLTLCCLASSPNSLLNVSLCLRYLPSCILNPLYSPFYAYRRLEVKQVAAWSLQLLNICKCIETVFHVMDHVETSH